MLGVLLGGTEAMRTAGREFLPQYENESNKNYEARLARATLLNMTEQTLETLVGKPFKEQAILGDDVPPQIEDLADDIDMQGNNLHSFSRSWFREGWAKGLCHVLVEHPTPEPPEDGQVRTLADDRTDGLRPFWVQIRPECLLAAYAECRDGKEVLTHIRILERTVERVGWEDVEKVRIRVLEPGYWWLYAPDEKGEEWFVEEEGTSALDYIPLVTFYAGKREGLMECKPPLTDLGHLNIAHWQSASDQRNVLTVARFPILAASGVEADQKVNIGPNNFLTTAASDGKWYYVEHTGAAIKAGAEDLKSLEDQMASYGAEFLRKKPGGETATARSLDSAEASSYLGATVRDFQDCVELAMQYTADWLRLEDGGSVTINSDVGMTEVQAAELDSLLKMRAQRDLSRASLVSEMQRRGVLADDFDAAADVELMKDEGSEGLGDMFGKGDGTQAPPPEEDPEEVVPPEPSAS